MTGRRDTPNDEGAVKGKLIEMGEIKSADLDGKVHTYPMALVITFDSKEDIRRAINERKVCWENF